MMVRLTRNIISAAAIMAAALPVSAAYAQSMVVNATGPSSPDYPKGTKLPADARITLKAQDKVIVVDRAGTRVLKGPGNFVLDGRVNRDRNLLVGLTRSVKNASAVRAAAGAVRAVYPGSETGTAETPDDMLKREAQAKLMRTSLWHADIDESGRVCYVQDQGLLLTRKDVERGRYAWLGMADGGAMTRLFWGRYTLGVAWPEMATPIGNGYRYRLVGREDAATTPSEEDVTEIELIELDALPEDNLELAQLLLQNGCEAQLSALLNVLPEDEGDITQEPAG